jgi:hypothetical protein
VDVSGLRGWSAAGEQAMLDAVRQLRTHPSPLALCGLRDLPASARFR